MDDSVAIKMFATASLLNNALIITLYTLGQKRCSREKAPDKDIRKLR